MHSVRRGLRTPRKSKGSWITGRTLPGTERVDLAGGGTTVTATLGDGVYVAWIPSDKASRIVMTTAKVVYTWAGTKMTKTDR